MHGVHNSVTTNAVTLTPSVIVITRAVLVNGIHNDHDGQRQRDGVGRDAVAQPPYTLVEMYLYTVVIPLICVVGIVGNSINLVVLTSIVRNKPMDRMERSATMGLLALAVSDLFFCSAVIPLAFVDGGGISDRLTLALVLRSVHST